MNKPDPVTPLTKAEQDFTAWLDVTSDRDTVLSELKANLQTAIEIELATIPIYLYTYYSLVRNTESGENIDEAQFFANKAGGIIMSVAVEEMLHMSLSSNILFSMGQAPKLYKRAPGAYPTGLPFHQPQGPTGPNGATAVSIPLGKLSFEQLWHFLQIEYPESHDALPQDRNWQTIGQFYSYIRCLLSTKFVTDADFRKGAAASAIQPYNYSPNNVDTVYPRGKFDPWKPAPPAPEPGWAKGDKCPSAAAAAVYPDTGDSHAGKTELVTIASIYDALCAIDTICDQGEGNATPVGASDIDDPSKREYSHYWKFLTLQAQFADYAGCTEVLAAEPKPPAPVLPAVNQAMLADVIVDFPDSPTNAAYPDELRPIATFSSACFQYMLIMTETIFRVPPDQQKLFFNEALHRSMIWVLDKYIRTIRQIPLTYTDSTPAAYAGKFMGPTFENVDLGSRENSFASLAAYGRAAVKAAQAIIDQDPQSPLASVMGNVIYYVGVATTKTGSDGAAMHLPDVGPYWADAGEPVPAPYPYKAIPQFPATIGTQPAGLPLHSCMGLNACKGADRFGVDGPRFGKANDCAGQGWCSTTADHTCHVQNECRNQGGCGLYGTGEEMNHPAMNDCRSQGSCATPINAERFSTNGPNRGKSVWLRAREVFAEKVWPDLRKELLAKQKAGGIDPDLTIPAKLGKPPAAFAATGPTYLWISEDNDARGNMTACGSSGMSGAGGCS